MSVAAGARPYPIPSVRAGPARLHAAPARSGTAAGDGLDGTIARAQEFLFRHQDPDGFWWGELESNPTMESEYVFLTHFLGIPDVERWRKIRNFILGRQQPDGGWSLYFGADSDLSTSCECYLALKLTGLKAREPALIQARDFILNKGGVEKTRVFTKIWFALLGEWEFAMWSRATIVPMSILLSSRPIHPVPEEATVDELFLNGREKADYSLPAPGGIGIERLMYAADRLLRLSNLMPWNPARARALRAAEKWICSHQEADGSWGGIQPPWVYSLLALQVLGYRNDHEVMRRGMEGFERYAIEERDTWRLQPSMSPLWDTCLSMTALLDSGVDAHHPAVVRAADWLIERQIRSPGDWQVRAREIEPGGWAFEFQVERYPDIDDAAEVLCAIDRPAVSDPQRRDETVRRGIDWVLGLQSRNGGWGAYDKDNTSTIIAKLPFFDFGETIDPPSVDVTAHIIEMLARLGEPTDTAQVRKALDYIWSEQEADGCWFGRWGVNYIYGTGSVLPALDALGHDMSDERVQQAADWIEQRQNGDGGWGESCGSYARPSLRGRGTSTASQTAWALLGLIASGRARSQSTRRGVDYLIGTQQPDGSWEEAEFTGTGFPGYGVGERRFKSIDGNDEELMSEELPAGFMIKYHMYRIYWPLMALARYRERLTGACSE